MCDPLTLAASEFALNATSEVVGFIGQSQQADAAKKAANLSYAQAQTEIGQRNVQIDAQQSEDSLSAVIAHAQEQGRISASASDMGLAQSTTAQLSNAASFAAGRDASISQLNAQNQRLQSRNMDIAAQFDRYNTIARNPKPSPLSLVLGIGKAGVGSASDYQSMTAKGGN